MKRKRASGELGDEYARQIGCLNKTFQRWIRSNEKANPLATWEEGCQDYVTFAEQLKERYCMTGTAASFGTGDCGQLGFGVEEGEEDMFVVAPRVIDTLKDKDISAIASGGMHNAVVCRDDGTVWTWGCSDNECLGRDGDENSPAPVQGLAQKMFVLQVSAGDCHTVALGLNGEVYIWGAYKDKDGKNFFPMKDSSSSFKHEQRDPVYVPIVSDVSTHGGATQIASGAHHTLVLCGDGTVYSWGIGDSGQLGRPVGEIKDKEGVYLKDTIFTDHLTPSVMRYEGTGATEVNNARYVACGGHHSFVIQAVRSRVFGCGLNQYSQLGFVSKLKQPDSNGAGGGKTQDSLRHITGLDKLGVSSVHGGEHSSVVVTHDGYVYTFGRSDNGQLGVPPSDTIDEAGGSTHVPQLVKFDPPARIVSACAGSFHCAAISSDDTMYTWGFGESGQLGLGKPPKVLYPPNEHTPKMLKNSMNQPLRICASSAGAQHTLILQK
mmetsp:Transcript_15876/g.24801  ORF Transcript_15876/g.24801 Transcript_15876/m.24801 type:complete len:492 (+) Transcript_15876:48-1523(+)